jgi:carboxylesterase type B
MMLSTVILGALALCASSVSADTIAGAAPPPTCKPCAPAAANFLTVPTTNGPVTGHLANNTKCVVEYLGIPFAKPPVGSLRFAAPQRFVADKPYVASNWGFDCPLTASKPVNYPGFTPQAQQIVNYFASAAGTPQSEDCLTLNIWSKPTANSGKALKPVLIFFYGGRK